MAMPDREWDWYVIVTMWAIAACLMALAVASVIVWWL